MFSLSPLLCVRPPTPRLPSLAVSLKCSITNYNNRKFSMRHIEKECHIWYERGRDGAREGETQGGLEELDGWLHCS